MIIHLYFLCCACVCVCVWLPQLLRWRLCDHQIPHCLSLFFIFVPLCCGSILFLHALCTFASHLGSPHHFTTSFGGEPYHPSNPEEGRREGEVPAMEVSPSSIIFHAPPHHLTAFETAPGLREERRICLVPALHCTLPPLNQLEAFSSLPHRKGMPCDQVLVLFDSTFLDYCLIILPYDFPS